MIMTKKVAPSIVLTARLSRKVLFLKSITLACRASNL
jgi:hypothetical protein